MTSDQELIGLPTGVSAEEAAAQFDQLQKKLVPLWQLIESFNQDEQTIVVIPSITVDMSATGFEIQGYEERFLFLLLLLAQPRARMIYVTSQAIHPSVIEYYLDLLSGVIPSHAMRRLTLLSPYDDSARPLSLKLLERPRLLERIEAGILDKTALTWFVTILLSSSEISPCALESRSTARTRDIFPLEQKADAGSYLVGPESITHSAPTT